MTADDLAWKGRAMQLVPSWLFRAGPAYALRLRCGVALLQAHRWLWQHGLAI